VALQTLSFRKITHEPQILVLISLGKVTAGVDEAELLASNWLGGIASHKSSGSCQCVYEFEKSALSFEPID